MSIIVNCTNKVIKFPVFIKQEQELFDFLDTSKFSSKRVAANPRCVSFHQILLKNGILS